MYALFRPFFFLFSPERIHHIVFTALRFAFLLPGAKGLAWLRYGARHPQLERTVMGMQFKSPVGLAAGFDKDARLFNELGYLGFSFVEVGTVTPKPQDGNPKPRLFRLKADNALINRMGFNNHGVEAMVARLRKRPAHIIVGGNIGKNKSTPNEEAVNDYLTCFKVLAPWVDYFVVNVSSPNTPGLRELQEKIPLTELLLAVEHENRKLNKRKPILLKIAPDLTNSQLNDIVEIILETGIDGVIATNTTLLRDGLQTPPDVLTQIGAGGLSGKPLRARSTEVIAYLAKKGQKRFTIIGVGGIHSAADALEKLNAGADLIQLYTGFVYEGPALVRKIHRELLKK
jgi:dihydroorotate dehydrogenase